MKQFDITNLNQQQQKALLQTQGAVLVTAGAGSGKTKLLTSRIAYLVRECGVPARNILAITFTNKAANEMKSRVSELIDCQDMIICTFHSLCVRILRRNISRLEGYDNNFSIYDESDSERVLKKIYAKLEIDSKDDITKKVHFHISNIKSQGIDPLAYKKDHEYEKDIDKIVEIFGLYQNELRHNNALDFDDLLFKTYELLIQNPDVQSRYQQQFQYILVDEFQDTNQIQYKLIKLLCHENPNIFAVGDEDQCIYTWRGANFKNIFDFTKDFDDVKVFKLEQNYRSTQKILKSANQVIKNNTTRLNKTLFTENEQGQDIVTHAAYDERAEADYVAMQISRLVSSGECSYGDVAVLSRLNALSFAFEERFMAYSIPYKVFGGFKFYDRAEVKNVLAYLKLFSNPNDEVSFLRAISFPKRGIGQVAVNNLRQFASQNNSTLVGACVLAAKSNSTSLQKFLPFANAYSKLSNAIQTCSLNEFVCLVVDEFNLKSAYDKNKEADLEKLLNIDAFVASVEEYAKANPDASLNEYLETVSLVSDLDGMNEGDNSVKIATIHSVKGLEFKVVFVVGLEEKIFPISRAYENASEMEEERRLMYVAMTRAEKRLFLTRSKTRFLYGKRDSMIASRFLSETGLEEVMPKSNNFSSQTPQTKTLFQWTNLARQSMGSKLSPPAFATLNADISIFKPNTKVVHKKFGRGTIESVNEANRTADVIFQGFGKKTLMLDIAPLSLAEGEEEND